MRYTGPARLLPISRFGRSGPAQPDLTPCLTPRQIDEVECGSRRNHQTDDQGDISRIACRTPKEERCNKRTGQGERGQHPPQADRAASSPRLRSTRLAVATTSTIVLAVRPAGAHSVIASRCRAPADYRRCLPHHLVPYPQPSPLPPEAARGSRLLHWPLSHINWPVLIDHRTSTQPNSAANSGSRSIHRQERPLCPGSPSIVRELSIDGGPRTGSRNNRRGEIDLSAGMAVESSLADMARPSRWTVLG
jgi:hypothetical protein